MFFGRKIKGPIIILSSWEPVRTKKMQWTPEFNCATAATYIKATQMDQRSTIVHWKSKHQHAAILDSCCKSKTEQLKNTSPSCCEIIQIKTKPVSILVEQSKLLWTDNGLPLLWTETVKHWNTTQDLKNEVAIQPLCELTILLLKHYTCISRMNWSKASTMHKCCP